jgi:hypothetical protein
VLGLFYVGGEMSAPLVPEMANPAHTDTLLYLMYGLFSFVVVVTVIGFIVQFGAALKDNPVAALKSLLGFVLLLIVLIATWALGSEEALVMTGYEGTENVPFWLKATDMFLYTLYFLIAVCVLAMIGSSVKKALS